MNKQLKEFARSTLKKGLAELPESNVLLFKRMYSPNDLTIDIATVVALLPEDKLDWAMQQVERTLSKLNALLS